MERVRELRGLSRRELHTKLRAAGIPVASPTLDYIANEQQRRCRRSVLNGLAKELGLSRPDDKAWLQGQRDRLPRAIPLPGQPDDLPDLVQLVENEFLGRCYEALRRDLEREAGRPERAERLWQRRGWRQLRSLRHLIHPRMWRMRLSGTVGRQPDDETVTDLLSRSFTAILRPWLTGARPLNYRALPILFVIRDATRRSSSKRRPR